MPPPPAPPIGGSGPCGGSFQLDFNAFAASGADLTLHAGEREHAADLRASAKGEISAKSKSAVAKKTAKKAAGTATKKTGSTVSGLVAKAKKVVKRVVRKVAS